MASKPKYPDMPDKFYEGLGWMHAECCAALDRGEDPRTFEIGPIVERCIADLTREAAPQIEPNILPLIREAYEDAYYLAISIRLHPQTSWSDS